MVARCRLGRRRATLFVLPALTLALPVIAYVTRLTTLGLLDVFRANFIRTARAPWCGWLANLWGTRFDRGCYLLSATSGCYRVCCHGLCGR